MSDQISAVITENVITSTISLGGAGVGYTPENLANKQNDLTASSIKYPTVDAVNAGLVVAKARGNHTGTQLATTISDFADTVRTTILTGYSVGSNAVIAATDTILQAFAKIQGQINAKLDVGSTTASISPSTNRQYLTDNQQINIGSVMLGITGVITGGVITINADPTKIDISAGTGCFIDWTTPSNPMYRPVSWDAVVGLTVAVGSGSYSIVEVTDTLHTGIGTIVSTVNKSVSAQARRNLLQLGIVSHSSLVAVTSVTRYQVPAWQTLDALIDYSKALGSVNSGNTAYAASTNLTVAKAAGTTTGLFLNYGNNPHSPNIVTNAAANPVNLVTSRRNGSGGFTYSALTTTISPDLYDTGGVSLTTVTNNRYTIQRVYFGGASPVYTVTYGQAQYTSIAAAEAAIFSEAPVLSPQVTSSAVFVTALIVKKGCTNLADPLTAKFVNIIYQGSGGSVAAVTNTAVTAVTSIGGVLTIDCSLGDYFTTTLFENITSIVYTNTAGVGFGMSKFIQITQDNTTARTVALPSSKYKTSGGAALTVSTTLGDRDDLALTSLNNGTTWDAVLSKAYS